MKRILSILLVTAMLFAMFVLPSNAEGSTYDINFHEDIPFVTSAPKADGVVDNGEYGSDFPQHSYSKNPEQFSQTDDHDDYNNWDVEFYSAWDNDNLYMAWVVKSEIHKGFVKGTYDGKGNLISDEWPEDGSMLAHMWWGSCIQFIITPGAPGGNISYASNYLEAGLCQYNDGGVGKIVWSYPNGVSKEDITDDQWDAAIVRDDANNTTTYEVVIPKTMLGVYSWEESTQFGVGYAAAAQENYITNTRGMLEWQDAMLSSKQPDNAAVITLVRSENIIPEDAVEYNGHYYKVYNENLTWSEAKDFCEQSGGYLATITSEEEQEIINSLLIESENNCYWVGGYKDGNQWRWVTDENFVFTDWGDGEPSNDKGIEDKLHVFGKSRTTNRGTKNIGDWNDCANDGASFSDAFYELSNYGFLCEWGEYEVGTIYTVDEGADIEIIPNDAFESGTTVNVAELSIESIHETVKDIFSKFIGFDFNATKDGKSVQPNKKIKVNFAIPEGFSNNVSVQYVSPDGKMEKVKGEIDTNTRQICAELEHFSTYVLVDNESAAALIGDINANREIDSLDYILLKRAYFGTFQLSDTAKSAGDINGNGEIDSLDYILLKRAYFGTYEIK